MAGYLSRVMGSLYTTLLDENSHMTNDTSEEDIDLHDKEESSTNDDEYSIGGKGEYVENDSDDKSYQTKNETLLSEVKKPRLSIGDSAVSNDNQPVKNEATADCITDRKWLNLRRWYCMSRPQYKETCSISSLVSCWNYLFSTLGGGRLFPITQEEALHVLGFKPPFDELEMRAVAGNNNLMRWFLKLNAHYKVKGSSSFVFKPNGSNRTCGITSDDALQMLKKGLREEDTTFIYHCENHYFCPIGFEDVPFDTAKAFKTDLQQEEVETWILIGEITRRYPGIQCIRWEDILQDLNCQNPQYLDIRQLWLGEQTKQVTKDVILGENVHCIMTFKRG